MIRTPDITTKVADAAIATQNLLVKFGSDADHIAVAGASDVPLGVCIDTPDAGDSVGVDLLGLGSLTKRVVASAEIVVGAELAAAAGGKVVTLPTDAGTYYVVGRAFTAASGDGEELEMVSTLPRAVVVSE